MKSNGNISSFEYVRCSGDDLKKSCLCVLAFSFLIADIQVTYHQLISGGMFFNLFDPAYYYVFYSFTGHLHGLEI